jgi:hypothetical protein
MMIIRQSYYLLTFSHITAYTQGMRIQASSFIFTAAAAITALLVAAASLILALFIINPKLVEHLAALAVNPWWFIYREGTGSQAPWPLWPLAAAIATALVAGAAGLRGRTQYRRSPAPLLPFVLLFLFSLALECLRAGAAWLYASDRSISAGVVLTRVVYWARFVGLLSLLLAGLSCIELKLRRFFVMAGLVFFVSFAMAAYIPIDRTIFLGELTWKLGDEQGVWFVNLVIGILVVATSASGAFTRHDRRYLLVAAGFALLLLARELLFFSVGPAFLGAGVAAVAGGAIVCLWTLGNIYGQAGVRAGT